MCILKEQEIPESLLDEFYHHKEYKLSSTEEIRTH